MTDSIIATYLGGDSGDSDQSPRNLCKWSLAQAPQSEIVSPTSTWSERGDLNPRHRAWEARTLPTELRSQVQDSLIVRSPSPSEDAGLTL